MKPQNDFDGGKHKKDKLIWTNLDGLRGLGILIVIFYHMGYPLMRHGWLCISIFFAVSGFLITGITVQGYEKSGKIDIMQFWSRRVGRLFPALYLAIILCALSIFFRTEDEVELANERQDLLYACTFLTNYNMIFVRKDDYFAAFTKPSITRHLWTLSIEEQYYLVWPILFYCWSLFFPFHPVKKSSKETDEEMKGLIRQNDNNELFLDNEHIGKNGGKNNNVDAMRPFLKALCVGECVVITFSYFSSWATISKLGMSAAYYSTWSRMGDIACGGLVFLVVRLHPETYGRIKQLPGIKPMTTVHRIALELLWFLALCLTVFPPMAQASLHEMQHLYFYYIRLPFTFLICIFAVAGILQISEPLPRWAIFSRLMSSKFLTTLGLISYGVYLNHWPIILFFGNPVDHSKFEKDLQTHDGGGSTVDEGLDPVRDTALLLLSLTSAFIAFMYYEKPLLFLARKTKSHKVVISGLVGSALTAGVVVACFWDVHSHDVQNDAAAVFGNQISINSALPVITLDSESIQDERLTPIWLFTGWPHNFDTALVDILDNYTIPKEFIECHGATLKAHHHHDNTFRCGQNATPTIYNQLSEGHIEKSIFIMCKSYSNLSPCDVGQWKDGTKWIWLSSPNLCGEAKWEDNIAQERRCPEKLQVEAVHMDGVVFDESHNNTAFHFNSITGRMDLDRIYLIKLVFAVEQKIPGAINQHSLHQMNTFLRAEEAKEKARQRVFTKDEVGWSGGMKMLVMGESVAHRMSGFFKEMLSSNLPCISNKLNRMNMPHVEIMNLAVNGRHCLNFFIPCNEVKEHFPSWLWDKLCKEEVQTFREHVQQTVPAAKADVIFLHDGHWHQGKNYTSMTMSKVLEQAIDQGTRMFFFATSSATNERLEHVQMELTHLDDFLQEKSCTDNQSGIKFIVVKWHLMTCPTFDEGHCSTKAHGFPNILPDGQHPSGPSGEWLTAQVLSLIMGQIALDLPGSFNYSSWDRAIENPVSSCLLENNNPDDPLEDLFDVHTVCP